MAGAKPDTESHHAENAMIRTSLTEILGIQHPILSAPMGSVSGGVLASAVSGAGGLGFIGGGYGEEA